MSKEHRVFRALNIAHEDVVPVMVIRGCDIGPAATGQCSKYTRSRNKFGQGRIGSCSENIPETHEGEARP